MNLSRRGFFKLTGATFAAGALAEVFGPANALAADAVPELRIKGAVESPSICCYCAVGCGSVLSVIDGELVNLEGDPDHPINRGALCSKGSAQFNIRNVYNPETGALEPNPYRLTKVQYRAPGSSEWEVKDWEWAVEEIAKRVKATRDANYETTDSKGVTVNRCEAIGNLGGAGLDGEECYAVQKFARALGVTFIEHQARICHSATVQGLGNTFGRGAMTNHWVDLKNSDVLMVNGSNCAENHPISMKWITEAKLKGGKLIVVDPRFTRSAAVADLYVPLRSGTDIAFYGGLFNYVIENNLYHEEYVKSYTTASWLVTPDYSFSDGIFSGFDAATSKYASTTWSYQIDSEAQWDTAEGGKMAWVNKAGTPAFTTPTIKNAKKDATLTDPNCVWQLMKAHYSRYTPELVSSITGTPLERLLEVYALYASTGEPGKAGSILYAMGQTQHTYGSQNVRAMAMTQLLLGNMGVAGGGVNALRGESNVQGSTDMALLFHIVPGYMSSSTSVKHPTLTDYLTTETPAGGYWTNKPKFFISLLKELYGDYATTANDYAYDMLPKYDGSNHSHITMFEKMYNGEIEGLFCWGQNPAQAGPNCSMERKAMANLKWMVCADLWETETSIFWTEAAGVNPADINTEVFLLPAACHYEKQGEVANSGRWIQWRYKAVEPREDQKDDLEICTELVLKLKELYEAEGGANPEQITKLTWDYIGDDGHADITKVARALNGYTVADGKLLKNFTVLAADGSTACGNWVYSGYWNNNDSNEPADQPTGARNNVDEPGAGLTEPVGSYLGWSFAWPVNRRIIYNRASADPSGKPWNESKILVKWDGAKWLRNDVPDFGWSVTAADGTVTATPPNSTAFIMTPEGAGRFFTPSGMADGPFPEHYEPFESPDENQMSGTQCDPAITIYPTAAETRGTADEFPIVMTTFRVTEHWQSGVLTRNLPWLVQTMPKMFVELSPELAKEKDIVSGDNVVIENKRGAITAYAMVTSRVKPFTIGGKIVHLIGTPWHWGYAGTCSVGGSANEISPNVGDANTMIPESKAFLVNIRKQEV